jgi:hypothetical protein
MPMPRTTLRALALAVFAPLLLAACGSDSITGPQRDARRMATRFDQVGDSLYVAGQSDAGDGAYALAEVLRTTDRLNTVTATIDGEARAYHALLLQLQLPEDTELECLPDEPCVPAPTFLQVVVGWRGEDVTDGFAFLMDTTGALGVAVPAPDAPEYGHVLGGLFERAGERAWLATSGTVTNARAAVIAACQHSALAGPAPGVECKVGAVTFRASVGLDEPGQDGGFVAGSHRTLVIDGQSVAGLALTLSEIPDAARARLSPRRLVPMLGRFRE